MFEGICDRSGESFGGGMRDRGSSFGGRSGGSDYGGYGSSSSRSGGSSIRYSGGSDRYGFGCFCSDRSSQSRGRGGFGGRSDDYGSSGGHSGIFTLNHNLVTMRKGAKKMIGSHKCAVVETQNDEVMSGPLETSAEEAGPQDEVVMEKENDTGEEDRGKNKPAKPDQAKDASPSQQTGARHGRGKKLYRL